MPNCPIASAERRLRDAFHHWKLLEQHYFNPDRFRIALNSFLQEARNVTFILQKNKKDMAGFGEWYAPWQKILSEDPILRWAKESRNRITKEGDLETESHCSVKYTSGWTDELTREFKANPMAPVDTIISHVIKQVPREFVSEEGLICIERRWRDSNLPGIEILQAASHVLLVLSRLIQDAHEQIISKAVLDLRCENSQKLADFCEKYPFEQANADDTRKVWVEAVNRGKIKYDVSTSVLKRGEIDAFADQVRERYGNLEFESKRQSDAKSLDYAIQSIDFGSRRMLERDGRLCSFIHALDSSGKKAYKIGLIMNSRAEKHLAIRRAALLLEKSDIEWAVLSGESWLASYDPNRSWYAVDYPNKQEAITLNAVSATGQFKNKTIKFERQNGKIVFADEDEWEDESVVNIMLPILAAIRRR